MSSSKGGERSGATTPAESPPSLLGPLLSAARSRRSRDSAAEDDSVLERTLGDFRLIRAIGRGGMGTVYEAEQISLQRRVALKVLAPQLSLSPTDVERFRREAVAGGRLSHANLVAVYDVGEQNGVYYIAQELVTGSFTLAEFLADMGREQELPEGYFRSIAELFAKIANAMQAAHDQGVIHRDIKPGNLLITEQEEPKVADFGLARVNDDLVLSRTGELAGTPFYMSPEQAMSKRFGLDRRTDIFSLGATLYEALTLSRPFAGDTSQQVLEQIVTVDPPDPRRLRSKVPWDLAVICMKALEKHRERRYQTMDELAADLRRFLAHQPILAVPPGALTRSVKWTRRHPVISVSSAVLIVAFAMVTWLLIRTWSAEKTKGLALIEKSRALDEAQSERTEARRQSYVANLLAASASIEAEGYAQAQRRLDACPQELRNWEWNYLSLRCASMSLSVIDQPEVGVVDAALSPDGRRVAAIHMSIFNLDRHGLRVFDTETGELLMQANDVDNPPRSVAFSPDGDLVATGMTRGDVYVIDTTTGEVVHRLPGHDGTVLWVGFTPDSGRIVTAGRDGTVRIWDADTEESLAVLSGPGYRAQCAAVSPDGRRIAAGWNSGEITVWDADGLALLATLDGHEKDVLSLAFHPEGDALVSGSDDRTLRIWENPWSPIPGSTPPRSIAEDASIRAVAWSPDGRLIASGVGNVIGLGMSSLRLRDATTGEVLTTLWGHAGPVNSVSFSADGTRLASSSGSSFTQGGRSVRIWDTATRSASVTFADTGEAVRTLDVSPDGVKLLSGHGDGTASIWDARTGEQMLTWSIGDSSVSHAAFIGTGRRVAASRATRVGYSPIGLFDSETGAALPLPQVEDGTDRPWAISRSADRIAMASTEDRWSGSSVTLSDAVTGEPLSKLAGSARNLFANAFTRDGSRILSGHSSSKLTLWDTVSGEPLAVFESDDTLYGDAMTRDGGLVSVIVDSVRVDAPMPVKRLTIWDTFSGGRRDLLGHQGMVYGTAFSPDGTRLASRGSDQTILIWDTATGEPLLTLRGHDGSPSTALTFSPDGKTLYSGHADGTIRAWLSDSEQARTLWSALDGRHRQAIEKPR